MMHSDDNFHIQNGPPNLSTSCLDDDDDDTFENIGKAPEPHQFFPRRQSQHADISFRNLQNGSQHSQSSNHLHMISQEHLIDTEFNNFIEVQ